jgi:monoamine oxidase
METTQTDVLIIGGGLTGLTLAYLLKQNEINFIIVEARNRLGGRIQTKYNDGEAPIELGATWLIDQQNSALELLKDLNITVFEQHYGNTAIYHPNGSKTPQLVDLPKNNSKSYRINNGTFSMIEALIKRLDNGKIKTNEIINSIKLNSNGMEVFSKNNSYNCKYVVSTLPPLLLSKTITIEPSLPNNINTLLSETHTWMYDSIRIGLTYKTPFWKAKNTSGTRYSSVGPIQEFYDHTNAKENLHALSGFTNSRFIDNPLEERKHQVLEQLVSYYGSIALKYDNYEESLWKNEEFTSTKSERFLMPQTNNGHPLFQNAFLDNRLFIAGAETSNIFPGKMEGAITSAKNVFNKLTCNFKN